MKRCRTCGQVKPLAEFSPKRASCRACRRDVYQRYYRANRSSVLASQRARGPRPFDRDQWRRHRYGMSVADHQLLLERQGGRCAVCCRDLALVVDHDHDSGVVRGLLCQGCNCGIGLLDDDPERCLSAATYLEQGRETPDTSR